jgi:dihydroxyacetone kinase
MSKHLVNKNEDWAREALKGYLLADNRNLISLADYPNVIVRRDYTSLQESNSRVALISGGGSGHEPAHVGFIGHGMLTAVVCGDLFASPSTASILAAIRFVGAHNKAGVLLIVKNYTGDRLNFGIAAKRAQLEGINVDWLLVDDDIALVKKEQNDQDLVGRRGLCGTIYIHKLAGALAEQRKSLKEIKQTLDFILKQNYLKTIGISLSGRVRLPGEAETASKSDLDSQSIEIGLGIHGEAGRYQMKLASSSQLVEHIFDEFLFSASTPKDEISLMVNNLGGLSTLELHLLVNDCFKHLRTKHPSIKLKRLYVGTFMTSLNMNGFSLTLFDLDSRIKDDVLRLLDQITSAPAWPKTYGHDLEQFEGLGVDSVSPATSSSNAVVSNDNYLLLRPDLADFFKSTLKSIAEDLTETRDYLNELDSGCGDGDCGSSLVKISEAILAAIESGKFQFEYPHQVLLQCASIFENGGGTLCILLALFATSAANSFQKASASNLNENSGSLYWVKLWNRALKSGTDAVVEYGRAKPSQRSIVDPLTALQAYLNEFLILKANSTSVEIDKLLKSLVDVGHKSAQSTAHMKPAVGRASYVDASSIKTPDAGATAVSLIVSSIYKSYLQKKN